MATTVTIPYPDDAVVIMFAAFLLTIVAVVVGRWGRSVTHALLPVRDPVFLLIIMGEIVGMAALSSASPDDMWYAAFASVAVDAGYLIGSLISDPADFIYAELPSSDLGDSETGPLVYYTRKGQKYIVPQTLGAIVGNLIGIRCPLQMDLSMVRFRRGTTVRNKVRTIDLPAVNIASKHEVEYRTVGCCRLGGYRLSDPDGGEHIEPRYLFYRTIECHTIVWAETVTEDPREFLVHRDTWIAARDAVGMERQRSVRETVRANIGVIDKAGELLSHTFDLGMDTVDADDLMEYVERDMRMRGSKGGEDDGHTAEESS